MWNIFGIMEELIALTKTLAQSQLEQQKQQQKQQELFQEQLLEFIRSATQWHKGVKWSDFTEKQSSKFVIHGRRYSEFDYRVQV